MLVAHGIDLVLDVGAADGGFVRQIRQHGYTGEIVSFEPQAHMHAALQQHAASDPRWETHHLALGETAGTATINVASNGTSSSLLPMLDAHVDAAPHVTYVAQQTVEVARLDDVALQRVASARGTLLKIDTQGFEREVLSGGPDVVAACAAVQLELSLTALYEGGMLVDEAVSWAYDHGFRLVVIDQGYAAPTGEILQIDGLFVRS